MVGDSANVKISFTSSKDLGNSLLRLGLLAVAAPNAIPDRVRISGSAKSPSEIAEIVGEAKGSKIDIVSVDRAEYIKSAPDNFLRVLRFVLQHYGWCMHN